MRWRWLIGDYADAEFRLTREERRTISRRAHEKHVPAGALAWCTVAILGPTLVVMFAALPRVLDLLGFAGQSLPHAIGLGVVILVMWVVSAWAYARLYGRACRRAMRDLGREVCLECGYSLERLGTKAEVCPECGERVEHS